MGKVVGPGVQTPGRREVGREPLDHQLVQVLRVEDVLQPVLAEILERAPVRQVVLDQNPGGLRDQDLAPVRRAGDPGGPVHVDADVVAALCQPLAGVQAHPDPKGPALGPSVGGQVALGDHRGLRGAHRTGERHEEGVSLGADLDPSGPGHGGADDLGVLVVDGPVSVPEVLEQPGRAFDVGEQERDRAGRQFCHLGRQCSASPPWSGPGRPLCSPGAWNQAGRGGMDVLLENKNAVVYGGGGAVGGAVARAFAREGARVFLAGRTPATLDRVASEISEGGGAVETAQVDALDEEAVERHAESMAEKAGSIDVSFTAISHGDVHGMPLSDMPYEQFALPVMTALRAHFVTARAAARRMAERGSGVIMAITATTARHVIPQVGGTGVAFDAIESLCRLLASELGPQGIRVLWLQTTGLPEAMQNTGERFPDYGTRGGAGMTREEAIEWLRGKTALNRLTSLEEVGNTAAFLASDRASAVTGSGANLSCGSVFG